VLVEAKVASEPAAIATFIRAQAPQAVKVGFETGQLAAWHWHELKQLGLPVVCLDARHAKAALACEINKTDRKRRLRPGPAGAHGLIPRGPGQELRRPLCLRSLAGAGPAGAKPLRLRKPGPRPAQDFWPAPREDGRKGFAKQWPSSWRSKPRPTAGCCQQRPIVLLPPANCERNGSWYTERIAASTAPMNKAAINQSRSSARARAGSVGQRAPDRVNGEIKTR
jgi:hypothetical protein